jgi:isopenicillin N synthase-like dioxygenase
LEHSEIAQDFDDACTKISFFVVTGYKLPESTIDNPWKASMEFFGLPMKEKLASKSINTSEYPYGIENLLLAFLSMFPSAMDLPGDWF